MDKNQSHILPNDSFITSIDEYTDILNKEKAPAPQSIQDRLFTDYCKKAYVRKHTDNYNNALIVHTNKNDARKVVIPILFKQKLNIYDNSYLSIRIDKKENRIAIFIFNDGFHCINCKKYIGDESALPEYHICSECLDRLSKRQSWEETTALLSNLTNKEKYGSKIIVRATNAKNTSASVALNAETKSYINLEMGDYAKWIYNDERKELYLTPLKDLSSCVFCGDENLPGQFRTLNGKSICLKCLKKLNKSE